MLIPMKCTLEPYMGLGVYDEKYFHSPRVFFFQKQHGLRGILENNISYVHPIDVYIKTIYGFRGLRRKLFPSPPGFFFFFFFRTTF